jgi:hypothetical protein
MSLLLALLVAAAPDAFPLDLTVGKTVAVCKTGHLICPASGTICDDTSIVGIDSGPDGLVFKGLKPGTTLCSAASAGRGMRSVFRVTVKP